MRAPRYIVTMPVRYRKVAEAEWHKGRTVNISRSGVLFQADQLWERDTTVELVLELPATPMSATPARVSCRGRIARVAAAPAPDTLPALAAAFEDYEFQRWPSGAA